jgi:hypothetical protein
VEGLGERTSREELNDLFEEVDTDGSGLLEWAEFLAMIAGKMEEQAEPRSPTAMLRLALESVRAYSNIPMNHQ